MRDLDEVEEIAEPGPMRRFSLRLRARARAARSGAGREAFAPLSSLVEPSPPPAEPPNAPLGRAQERRRAKQLDAARELVAECGYHRRDEELAELDDVVAGPPSLRRSPAARVSSINPGSIAAASPPSSA